MTRAWLAAGLALALAGCGDTDLWARWRADRALYHARRAADAVLARGPSADPAARADAEAALEAIEGAFPATRWGTPPASGPARDVALAASRAALLRARLAAAAGEDAAALGLWRAARARWGALPGATVEAHAGAAAALERLDRDDEALQERLALAALDPMGDPDRVGPSPEVIAAPVAVAAELRAAGRAGEAAELLAAAEGRFAAALARVPPRHALAVATALAGLRASLGDVAGGLAALRTTLPGLRAWEAPVRALSMASFALEAGEPDSAIAYARWASSATYNRSVAGPALVLAARAWEALGVPDSALAAYDAVFERWTDPGAIGPEAHFRRARLHERLGQWERARAEFNALAAAAPTDRYAFLATLQVVKHHLEEGHFELARLEGAYAIERIEYLAATNLDPAVQRQAGLVRAELLLGLGFTARAESSLVDLWRRFPEDSATESAALRAASLAEHRPGGRAVAAALYDELARHAARVPVRREAARRRAALGRADSASPEGNRP